MSRSGEVTGSRVALYILLLWAPLASGAYRGWALAILQLLTLSGLLLWILNTLAARRLEWRRTALDLPLALLVALVLAQLALGNRPLATWALAPQAIDLTAPAQLPHPLLSLGTVAPTQTARSLLLFLTYAGVYVLVVNVIRERRQLDRIVRTLILLGGVLAFLGLVDYLGGDAWLIRWRDYPFTKGRLSGTFVNPDHFASWLAMLICLGLGYLDARRHSGREDTSFVSLLRSREARERAAQRYLPFISLAVMGLALVFTLSRGGIVSLLVTLALLLVLLGALGQTRWSLVVVGTLLAVVLSYGVWIGLEPLLGRIQFRAYAERWTLVLTSLPMLKTFPLLGVGLGAYRDIYFLYQPAALEAGRVYYHSAHNDLVQLLVESGAVGAVLCAFAMWRVGRDQVACHLLGRGRCPVGGGENQWAQRRDPFSVGIAFGAVGGVFALLVHSWGDFGARIPANGILAAACLGFATVALHTRFSAGQSLLTTEVRTYSLERAKLAPKVLGGTVLLLGLALAVFIARPALVEQHLQAAIDSSTPLVNLERVLAIDHRNVRALGGRARLRLDRAREIWNSGVGGTRPAESRALTHGAIEDLRTALAETPSDPFLHERLGWAYSAAAVIDAPSAPQHFARAITHLHRAIALAPENPFLYRSLAALTLTQGPALLNVGLSAARGAIQRDPSFLPELVDRFAPLGLSDEQWSALVPASAVDRLQLGALVEDHDLLPEAGSLYRRAVEVASPGENPLSRWMLAKLLMREGYYREAAAQAEAAIVQEPGNPELHLVRADALAALEDPVALEAYRDAALAAEASAKKSADESLPFRPETQRMQVLVSGRLGRDPRPWSARYRHGLAQYLTDRRLWDQALKEWDAVTVAAPQSASAHFSRGLTLEAMGKPNQALDAYRKAVSLDGRTPFRLRLAKRLWETDQYYQAINEWRAVISQEPNNVEAGLALARGYLRTGDLTDALREYKRVLRGAPDNQEARAGVIRLGGIP